MKNLIVLLIISCSFWGYSQDWLLADWNGLQSSDNVFLFWTIKAGNSCNGISILREDKSGEFQPIGTIEGVCGNPFNDTKYTFTDPNPHPNALNRYRLDLGGLFLSDIREIEFLSFAEQPVIVQHRESEQRWAIRFQNETKAELTLTITTIDGRIKQTFSTSSDSFSINEGDFPFGVYFFTLESILSPRKLSGKLLLY